MGIVEIVEDVSVEMLRRAVTSLPPDVMAALKNAYQNETAETGKTQLKAILDNIELGCESIPLCQDTGVVLFYATVGKDFGDVSYLCPTLAKAVRRATVEVPLRPNAVHPLTRKNSNDNTGTNMPHVTWDVSEGDQLELTVMTKGAGSENMSSFSMLQPGLGEAGVKAYVIDHVIRSDAQPCPPTIAGVGLGGSADVAMELAKKALLRPLGKPHPELEIADLERSLLKGINMTGIGPMGLGGNCTSLGVNVEYAYCHTASLPVALNLQCWAARRATSRISSSGDVEIVV
ncbi:MAG: fumarate hydratase [archaeon]